MIFYQEEHIIGIVCSLFHKVTSTTIRIIEKYPKVFKNVVPQIYIVSTWQKNIHYNSK